MSALDRLRAASTDNRTSIRELQQLANRCTPDEIETAFDEDLLTVDQATRALAQQAVPT